MVSKMWSSVLCVSCLVLVQAVLADYCTSYSDQNGVFYDAQQCEKYCCGNCVHKYCCSNNNFRLTEEEQGQCPTNSPLSTDLIVGIVFAVVIPVFLGLILIVCCVSPHCLINKRCRKRHNQRQTIVERNTPQSPRSPPGPQPAYGGYQSVPGHEGLPMASAPPPSIPESTEASSPHGHALHPLSQPQSPSYSEEFHQLPYNPSYAP